MPSKSAFDSAKKNSIKPQDTNLQSRQMSLNAKVKAGLSSPGESGMIESGSSIKIPPIPSDLQPIELNEGVLVSAMLNE